MKNIDPYQTITIEKEGEFVLVPVEIWNSLKNQELTGFSTSNPESFGILLKIERTLKKLSQKELARRCSLVECQISLYENDMSKPNSATIKKFKSVLGEEFIVKAKNLLGLSSS